MAYRHEALTSCSRKFALICRTHEMTWNIDRGQIVTLKYADVRAGGSSAIELNALSGLIGVPELTDQGLLITALLNPIYVWGARIHINNKVLTQGNPAGPIIIASQQAFRYDGIANPPGTDADGFYKVLTCDFSGDTRGNDWHAHMICLALDTSAQLPTVPLPNPVPP